MAEDRDCRREPHHLSINLYSTANSYVMDRKDEKSAGYRGEYSSPHEKCIWADFAVMTMAPPHVSLPWSMISILIPFILADKENTQSAIDGLQKVSSILASYNFAEQDLLSSEVTRTDYEKTVLGLYTAIFRFQATTALYVAQNSLKRFGYNLKPSSPFKESLNKVKDMDELCHKQIHDLGLRLTQRGVTELKVDLPKGFQLIMQFVQNASPERMKRERVLEWISPINEMQDHQDVRDRLGATNFESGRWLLEDTENYRPRRKSRDGVLLLRGIVGSGKSSLMSIVIQDFAESSQDRVTFFYCSANASTTDSLTAHNAVSTILRSLLAQRVVQRDGSIADAAEKTFDASPDQRSGRCSLLPLPLMKEIFDRNPDERYTVVIDALDECSDRSELLDSLRSIFLSSNLRILVSSRHGFDISEHFPAHRITDVKNRNAIDIHAYVEREVSKRARLSGMDPNQSKRLVDALEKQSDGVFRWVVLELEIFFPRNRRQGKRQQPGDIDRKLRKLENMENLGADSPEKIYDAYEVIYQAALGDKDDLEQRDMVTMALTWVLCAF